jgi:pyridoxamine 5'-phosphate oxidase
MDPTEPADPIETFRGWLAAAAARRDEPISMTLATAASDGAPSARMVLLKQVDERGFVFFTNLDSAKARDLAANPRAALVFHWQDMGRQVRVTGSVEQVAADEADAYFATRPVASRLSAWASHQSSVIAGRAVLEERVAELAARWPDGAVPRPPWWGGYRVVPEVIEFWTHRDDRLHDRLRYTRDGAGAWGADVLAP